MKLLVVMTHYPFPPRTGSAILAYHNIKEMAKQHSIYFICADDEKEQGDFAEFVEHMEFVGRKKRPFFIKLFRYAFYMLLGLPAWAVTSMSTEMCRRVSELIDQHDFDAILLYEVTAIQYCPQRSYQKLIVNIEDPSSIKLGRLRKLEVWSLWQRINLYILEKMTARYEKSIFSKLAKVLVLAEADQRDMYTQQGYTNIGCVPYGIDKIALEETCTYEERKKGMIVFSGNMNHPPNVDAALFFILNIFPLILEKYPSATLWIVGAAPDMRIRDAAGKFNERIVITGRVNDVSAYLRIATVSVCPVRLKIGVQTKILEALAWGTPVVTTSAGNSGICGSTGNQLWVEDDPDKFASHVVALLHGERWLQFSEEGRKLVAERFSWKRSAVELERHLELMWAANK